MNLYGRPALGNFRDPVKEIFYIVLSAKTTERVYKSVHDQLRRRFSDLSAIQDASLGDIRAIVASAGLGSKRAAQIKAIASRLLSDFGKRPASKLRQLPPTELYAYLRSLPGIGPKSALFVMRYSFGLDVFPVDANVQRVLCRIGVIKPGAKHYQAQATLPAFVPDGLSKDLHVALVAHGRHLCRPRLPDCADCPISRICDTGRRAKA